MENKFLKSSQQPERMYTDSLFAEMMLDKAIHDFKKAQLLKEIDQSLSDRNKQAFLNLTEQLKKIS